MTYSPSMALICYNSKLLTLVGTSQYLRIVNFCHC